MHVYEHVKFLHGVLVSAGAEKRLSVVRQYRVPPSGSDASPGAALTHTNCSHSDYEYTSDTDTDDDESSSSDWSDEDDVPKKQKRKYKCPAAPWILRKGGQSRLTLPDLLPKWH